MRGTSKKIPHRPHASKYINGNNNLPQTVPIIGLGCSSFSTFFQPPPPEEYGDNSIAVEPRSGDDDGAGGIGDGVSGTTTPATVTTNQQPQSLTIDNIEKTNPVVTEWIGTIRHAILNRGITLLDTSPWYGHGISETVIGYALEDILTENVTIGNESISTTVNETKEHHPSNGTDTIINTPPLRIDRKSLIINTKIGRYESNPTKQFDFSYSKTLSSTQLSITRMHCHYIDVLQLHDPEFAPSIPLLLEQTIPAMLECRDGLKIVRALGITGYPLEVQHEILCRSSLKGRSSGGGVVFDQALTYCHFNLHDMSLFLEPIGSSDDYPSSSSSSSSSSPPLSSSALSRDVTPSCSFAEYCHSNSIPLMTAAPLSMGLLKNTPPPDWHPASPALRDACRRASEIAVGDGTTVPLALASLAILFALSHPDVSCTLIGMKSVEEVDRACDVALRFGNVYGGREMGDNDKETGIVMGYGDDRKSELESKLLPILQEVLTEEEYDALRRIRDTFDGPFGDIWKSGEYRWDGKEEANVFWDQIPGGRNS